MRGHEFAVLFSFVLLLIIILAFLCCIIFMYFGKVSIKMYITHSYMSLQPFRSKQVTLSVVSTIASVRSRTQGTKHSGTYTLIYCTRFLLHINKPKSPVSNLWQRRSILFFHSRWLHYKQNCFAVDFTADPNNGFFACNISVNTNLLRFGTNLTWTLSYFQLHSVRGIIFIHCKDKHTDTHVERVLSNTCGQEERWRNFQIVSLADVTSRSELYNSPLVMYRLHLM